jgi:hypothetical protein
MPRQVVVPNPPNPKGGQSSLFLNRRWRFVDFKCCPDAAAEESSINTSRSARPRANEASLRSSLQGDCMRFTPAVLAMSSTLEARVFSFRRRRSCADPLGVRVHYSRRPVLPAGRTGFSALVWRQDRGRAFVLRSRTEEVRAGEKVGRSTFCRPVYSGAARTS